MRFLGSALFLFHFLVGQAFAQGSTMYVISPDTQLKSATTASATVLMTLKRGTPVSVLSQSGSWAQVTVQGKSGWVYKFKLSATKPSGEVASLSGLGGGGASAREGSTATSIRGLSPTSEKYAGRAKIKPEHVKMVKHMESLRVNKKEVEAFLRDGKLGEYAQ